MELPTFIPLFPLPNVVLFPEVPLPLHVFEPRYRDMVRDAQAGSGLIGMVLLRGGWQSQYDAAPDVYRLGCAGKIVESTPLPDGKFNIVLAGLREFEIITEQRQHAYRQATVRWRASAEVALPPGLRTQLVDALSRYAKVSGDDVSGNILGDMRLDDGTLVNFFSFWLDFDLVEKQCLLEAAGADRAQRLLEMLEFRLHAPSGEPGKFGMH